MKCKIALNNGKAGGLFTTKGDLNFGTDGFSLMYTLDGDRCVLRYSNGEILQERRGSAPMIMRFKEGEETLCRLGLGASSGSFPLYTDKIEVVTGETAVEVQLNYTCCGENVTLSIKAKS